MKVVAYLLLLLLIQVLILVLLLLCADSIAQSVNK